MDSFTDQDSKLFLDKEWLAKIDNANSRPYLFKFHSSKEDNRSRFLITDTKNVWFEAINPKQLARRWRHLNRDSEIFEDDHQEDAWRSKTLDNLTSIHTLKSMQESTFSIEESRNADFAVDLQTLDCKWRWEVNTLGAKASAEVLSSHLILPLISITHLSFTSADPVSELTTQDLEQAVDKVAKTGRRSQDVHVRQTLARPRVATTLRRMTAMFNFREPIPPIISVLDDETEDVDMASAVAPPPAPAINSHAFSSNIRAGHQSPNSNPKSPTRSENPPSPNSNTGHPSRASKASYTGTPDSERATRPADKKPANDSATEPESDGEAPTDSQLLKGTSQATHRARSARSGPSRSRPARADSSSDSSPPPARPSKKAKVNVVPEDSSGDSERERKKTVIAKPGTGRGMSVRQPIKRGGRRF